MSSSDPDQMIRASWDANAAAWTTAVREELIPSRRAGTDAAILAACTRLNPQKVLDVGCGEGWLTRALACIAREVVGIDGSAALVAEARASGGASYEVVDYEALIADATQLPGPWDLIVCNYALLGDPLFPLLAALRRRLSPTGRLLIQTVHPWFARRERPYDNQWLEETFAGFGVTFRATMPWFYRTLSSWISEVQQAGLNIETLEEPMNMETGEPLSMILQCLRAD